MPAIDCSASRSSMILTGAPPAFFESCAATMVQRSGPNLLPKPPPTWSIFTRMSPAGMPKGPAICPAMPDTFCVEMCTSRFLSLSHSEMAPCDSRQQCVMTVEPYSPSETTSASWKALSGSPWACSARGFAFSPAALTS